MSQVHVVIDSIGQISTELLEQHPNLHRVSLKVALGDQEWCEPDISTAELFRLAKERNIHPKTSQPAPGEFLAILEPLLAAGHDIVMIHVSGGLSGTVRGAEAVARMLDEKRIHVIDSGTASVGMEQMALAALKLAAEGESAAAIAAHVRKLAAATHSVMVPDTLEYLHKGGRIGGAAALFGTILQIKPIIFLVEGKVAVLDKVRTKQRALNRMLEELNKHGELEYIGLGGIDVPDEVAALRERVREMFPHTPIVEARVGSVLGSHLGHGLIGLVFQEKI